MSNVNVNRQAFNALQKIDSSRDGKIELKELQAAADTDGDGKVGLQEAANLERDLGRYVDKNLATQLAEAALGSKPVQLNYRLFDPPVIPQAGAERISGPLSNTRVDSGLKMQNSPPDPPTVLRSSGGQPLNVSLQDGVTLSQWSPAPVTFTDPETGKPANGSKVTFSTGDVLIIPQGQALTLVKPQERQPGEIQIGGQTQYYRLDEQGKASNDVMTMRYATVFCRRGF